MSSPRPRRIDATGIAEHVRLESCDRWLWYRLHPDETDELWDVRALNLVTGLDFLAGPLALRLHFGYPIQIGPVLPSDGWVTNFALRLRY